jgi:hypothetical protein
VDAAHVAGFGDSNVFGVDGDSFPTLKALLHGYIDTACTAGNLQTRMAQNTANASNTTVLVGS